MNKVFYINKQANMTSFDCISLLKKKFNYKKMGHTGTLDINATGLLIVLTGKYTKFLPYCQHNNKQYIATMQFGYNTDSKDIWGNKILEKPVSYYDENMLQQAVRSLIGPQLQTPPMISSKKVNGKRLLEYAAKGQQVQVEPKHIEVYDAKLLKTDPITVYFNVSSGTYVRNLCEDIATKLNNCGVMSSLVRTSIGNVDLKDAKTIDELTIDDSHDIKEVLDPSIPVIEVEDKLAVMAGKPLRLDNNQPLVFLKYQQEIIAVYYRSEDNIYKSQRGLF